jgi:hypothetical protein
MTTDIATRFERESREMVATVQGLAVTDAESYAAAGEWIKAVTEFMRRVNEFAGPIVKATHDAHKVAVHQRDQLLKPAEGAKRILGTRMAEYDEAQRRAAREAAEAARREQERREAEARAAALAEEARLRKEAEDARVAEAARMEQAGDQVGAVKLLEQPVEAPVVVPAPVFAPAPPVAAPPKVEGVSYVETWSGEVADLALLVKAVAAGEAPITLLQANTAALNALARSMKGQMTIPGVKWVSSRTARVRAS